MRRIDIAFWGKIALTSLFVNVPLAVGMVVYGLHPVFAFGFSALAGMGTLVVWDDGRSVGDAPADAAEEIPRTATPAATVRQTQTEQELARVS